MARSLLVQASLLALIGASAAQTSPCPSQQSAYVSSATEWPQPTGDLGSFISSYSSAHDGVFSGCSQFTSDLPSSLSTPYQEWVTSASQWSVSFESMVSSAGSTCLALVAPVVIALPLCPDDSSAAATTTSSGSGGSSPTSASAGSSASSAAASSTAGSSSSSGAASLARDGNSLFLAVMACASIAGAFLMAA